MIRCIAERAGKDNIKYRSEISANSISHVYALIIYSQYLCDVKHVNAKSWILYSFYTQPIFTPSTYTTFFIYIFQGEFCTDVQYVSVASSTK